MRPLKMHKKITSLSLMGCFLGLVGCGVKGDPLPPLKPSTLGRGEPTYRKATEKIPLQDIHTDEDNLKEQREPEDE
jgi:hypothetical protein